MLFGLLIVTSQGACNAGQMGMQLRTMANAIMIVNMFVFAMIIYWTVKFMKEDFGRKEEMVLLLLGAIDKKLDEEKGKIGNQGRSRMTKKEEEPESLSKTEKGNNDIPNSQDIVVNATSLDLLEECAFIEVDKWCGLRLIGSTCQKLVWLPRKQTSMGYV